MMVQWIYVGGIQALLTIAMLDEMEIVTRLLLVRAVYGNNLFILDTSLIQIVEHPLHF